MQATIERVNAKPMAALSCAVVAVVAILAMLSHATALTQDDGEVVSGTADMRGDGSGDTTERDPEAGPGEVRIRNNAFGDTEIVLRGRWAGDRFGESVAILNDVNGNGRLDLIVGAPGARLDERGEAYVFYGPFVVPDGENELVITADDADLTLESFFEDDYDFGRRVAALHDLNGDDRPELRVQSLYTHSDGEKYLITQVYSSDGNLMFGIVANPCSGNPWAPLTGDALGDLIVANNDVLRVALNYGIEGENLTPFDGDLNGDGIVDEVDLDLVMDNYGLVGQLLDIAGDVLTPPEIGGNELAVLNYDEQMWYAVPSTSPIPMPVMPGNPLLPVRPLDITPICLPGECDPSDECVFGAPGGDEDPCDTDICHPECLDRYCDASCCENDPSCNQQVEQYGECHEDCPSRFCHAHCCENDPECDQQVEQYGTCHPECELSDCDPACPGSDPCAEKCEEFDFGPCSDECESASCNAQCGGNPCASACAPYGGGPCGETCPSAKCNPLCSGSSMCNDGCEPYGGGPCSSACESSGCNPACNNSSPCSSNCEQFGWGPCSAGCSTAMCKAQCGGSSCHPACPNAICDPTCGGNPLCNPACGGNPCLPMCGGDPCSSACGGNPVCDPACGGNPENPECTGECSCPWEFAFYEGGKAVDASEPSSMFMFTNLAENSNGIPAYAGGYDHPDVTTGGVRVERRVQVAQMGEEQFFRVKLPLLSRRIGPALELHNHVRV